MKSNVKRKSHLWAFMAFLAFWDSFQFQNVYILYNLLFFAFHLYVKKAFKKGIFKKQ